MKRSVLLVVALLALGACGGGGETPNPSPTDSPTETTSTPAPIAAGSTAKIGGDTDYADWTEAEGMFLVKVKALIEIDGISDEQLRDAGIGVCESMAGAKGEPTLDDVRLASVDAALGLGATGEAGDYLTIAVGAINQICPEYLSALD